MILPLHRLSERERRFWGVVPHQWPKAGFSKSFLASKRFRSDSNGRASFFFCHNQNHTYMDMFRIIFFDVNKIILCSQIVECQKFSDAEEWAKKIVEEYKSVKWYSIYSKAAFEYFFKCSNRVTYEQ